MPRSFRTAWEIRAPVARPASLRVNIPITFPMSFIEEAPVSSITAWAAASISASSICRGEIALDEPNFIAFFLSQILAAGGCVLLGGFLSLFYHTLHQLENIFLRCFFAAFLVLVQYLGARHPDGGEPERLLRAHGGLHVFGERLSNAGQREFSYPCVVARGLAFSRCRHHMTAMPPPAMSAARSPHVAAPVGQKKLVQFISRAVERREDEDEGGGFPLGPSRERFPPGPPEQPGREAQTRRGARFCPPLPEGWKRDCARPSPSRGESPP